MAGELQSAHAEIANLHAQLAEAKKKAKAERCIEERDEARARVCALTKAVMDMEEARLWPDSVRKIAEKALKEEGSDD
jgi:hypothetical protein